MYRKNPTAAIALAHLAARPRLDVDRVVDAGEIVVGSTEFEILTKATQARTAPVRRGHRFTAFAFVLRTREVHA